MQIELNIMERLELWLLVLHRLTDLERFLIEDPDSIYYQKLLTTMKHLELKLNESI